MSIYAGAMSCTKASFDTEAAALQDLARIRSQRIPNQWKIPNRVYECHCGFWHLTSSPKQDPRA